MKFTVEDVKREAAPLVPIAIVLGLGAGYHLFWMWLGSVVL